MCVVLFILSLGAALRVRIYQDWAFIGQDSYDYIYLSKELRNHHRYATGADVPLHYSRTPGYPLFLWAVEDGHDPVGKRTEKVQIALDLLVTGLLTWWIARRLGGAVVAAIALAASVLYPWTAIFPECVLTETTATLTTTVAVALLLWDGRRHALRVFLAGAVAGLGVLIRPDGLLIAPAFILPLLRPTEWRQRLRLAGLGLAGFVLVYGAWPVRNLIRFGHPYWVGTYLAVDRKPLEYAWGYRHWLASWAEDNGPVGLSYCFYNRGCQQAAARYSRQAFADDAERAEVDRLLAARRVVGIDKSVSDGFEALAAKHRAAHPFHVLVELPLLRAYHLWVNKHDDLNIGDPRWRPWHWLYEKTLPRHRDASAVLFFALLIGSVVLVIRRRTRELALIILGVLVFRTLVLAWTYNVEPRYMAEVTPLAFVTIAAGLGELARTLATRVGSLRSNRFSSPRSTR